MSIRSYCKVVLFSLVGCFFFSCGTSHRDKDSVDAALNHYDDLVLKLDADSIALLYTPDGKMGEMAQGRDSIRAFLATFQNIKVLSQHSTSDTVMIVNDTAVQRGKYRQTDVISGRDTVNVKGEYTATWQWMKDGGWHIKQMETKPTL